MGKGTALVVLVATVLAAPALARAVTAAPTRLSIDVWPAGRTVPAGHRHYALTCAPAHGTVPNPGRACAALATIHAPFARNATGSVCPSLALGPQEAHVVGLVRGVRVDAWLNLRGCGISRWDRVKAVVPEPAHALTPK